MHHSIRRVEILAWLCHSSNNGVKCVQYHLKISFNVNHDCLSIVGIDLTESIPIGNAWKRTIVRERTQINAQRWYVTALTARKNHRLDVNARYCVLYLRLRWVVKHLLINRIISHWTTLRPLYHQCLHCTRRNRKHYTYLRSRLLYLINLFIA